MSSAPAANRPGRWFYGWNVIGAGMAFQAMLFGLTFYSFIFWAPVWAEEFQVNLTEVMWANVGMMVAQGMMSPVVGHFMDRKPIKWLVTAGACIAATGFIAVSLAQEVWQIILIYSSLIPMGVLLAGPLAAQTLAAKWFNARRGLAIGISTTGTSIGGFLLPILVGVLFTAYGWRDAHVVLAVLILLVVLPPTWFFVANTPEEKGVAPEVDPPADLTTPQTTAVAYPEWTTLGILKRPNFWIIILSFLPLLTAQAGVQANLAAFALEMGTPRAMTTSLISVMAIAMIFGKLFFGRQADRWDHRYLFLIAVAAVALVMALMLTEPGYSGQVVVACLLGIGSGAFLPLLAAMISSRFGPAGFGKVMGLVGPFTTLAALGSVYMANVYDATGAFQDALHVFLLAIIPAGVFILFLRR